MNIIPCGEQCVHQKDGCCGLEKPLAIINSKTAAEKGCLYFTPEAGSPPQPQATDSLG